MTSNAQRGGRRYAPYAFTEQGVAMLSSVLRSERAIRHAVGQQALEGLTIPASAIAEMRRAGRGEISVRDVINCFYKRYPNAPVFRPS